MRMTGSKGNDANQGSKRLLPRVTCSRRGVRTGNSPMVTRGRNITAADSTRHELVSCSKDCAICGCRPEWQSTMPS
jgi:hypothetical protein